jgi:glycine cleavage system aminomethyltransferase T
MCFSVDRLKRQVVRSLSVLELGKVGTKVCRPMGVFLDDFGFLGWDDSRNVLVAEAAQSDHVLQALRKSSGLKFAASRGH